MTAWIDETAGIYAMEVMRSKRLVTLKISEIMFKEPVNLGDILEYCCKINKEGRTSLTIGVRVRRILEKEIRNVCEAEIVFVNLNEEGKPTPWRN
jgi:acyl-CoA thioesterase YciA